MHLIRRGTVLIAVLALSALALVAVTGYLWFKNNMQPTKPTENRYTNSNISPTPLGVDTSGWLTCENSTYGYSIKYPTGFSLDKTTCSYAPDPKSLDAITPDSTITEFQKNWVVNISVEKSTLDLPEWITFKKICPTDFNSCTEIKIDPVLNSTQFDELNRRFSGTTTLIKQGDLIYRLDLGSRNQNTPVSTEIKTVYNQLLTTFKLDLSK